MHARRCVLIYPELCFDGLYFLLYGFDVHGVPQSRMHGPWPSGAVDPGIAKMLMIEAGLEFSGHRTEKSMIMESTICAGKLL